MLFVDDDKLSDDFKADSLWSERVAALYLEARLPGMRKWEFWLRNDRRKAKPLIQTVSWNGWNVLYRRLDVENFAKSVKQKLEEQKDDGN